MENLLQHFANTYNYWIYIVIMMIGIYGMIAKNNIMKKLIALGIFQTSIMLFYVAVGSKAGGTIPILIKKPEGQLIDPTMYINPLPHVLMLTAIVVSVATLGVALSLAQRVFNSYNTLEEDEIGKIVRGENLDGNDLAQTDGEAK